MIRAEMTFWSAWTLLLIVCLAGCQVTLPEGGVACASDGSCPEGWECVEDLCLRQGVDAGADASDATSDVFEDTVQDTVGDSDAGSDSDSDSDSDSGTDCTAGDLDDFRLLFQGEGSETIGQVLALDDGWVVVGTTSSTSLDIGCMRLSSSGLDDGFIARVDREGRVVWAKTIGGPTGNESLTRLDRAGERIVAVGNHETAFSVDLSGGGSATIEASTVEGSQFAFVVSFDLDGGGLWARSLVGTSRIRADAISATANRVCVGGRFSGTAAIGRFSLDAGGDEDGYFACLDAGTGNPLFATGVRGDRGAARLDVVLQLDLRGDDLIVGGAATNAGTDLDAYLYRFGCSGSFDSCEREDEGSNFAFPAPRAQRLLGFERSSDRHLVAVRFNATISVGEDTFGLDAVEGEPAAGSLYIASFEPGGAVQWAVPLGVTEQGSGIASIPVSLESVGETLYVAGSFYGAYQPDSLGEIRSSGTGLEQLDVFFGTLDLGTGAWESLEQLGTSSAGGVDLATSENALARLQSFSEIAGGPTAAGESDVILTVQPF